jgi:lipase ATG15
MNESIFTVDHFIVQLSAVIAQKSISPGFSLGNLSKDVYPSLCTKAWHGINVWELAWLALAPYVTNADVSKLLTFMEGNMEADWEAHFPSDVSPKFGTVWWDGFIEFHSPARNVSVIAIRGTDLTSFADALQDINMFFEVALYHTLSSIVPGASMLPHSLVADFIKLASGVDSISGSATSWSPTDSENSREYYSSVYRYLLALQNRRPPKHVVMVGHSLGGAVGHIVGSKLGFPSLGFSSPGLTLSRKKFGIELPNIHQFTTTIISSHDIVPLIGGQGGELHHVECLAERRELCHAVEFLVGTLWHSCGTVREKFPKIEEITLL